jgi:hypothetical protein
MRSACDKGHFGLINCLTLHFLLHLDEFDVCYTAQFLPDALPLRFVLLVRFVGAANGSLIVEGGIITIRIAWKEV